MRPRVRADYAGGFAVGNISYNLLWWSIALQRRLLHPNVTRERVNSTTTSFLFGFPVYLGATLLAFCNACASIGDGYGALSMNHPPGRTLIWWDAT